MDSNVMERVEMFEGLGKDKVMWVFLYHAKEVELYSEDNGNLLDWNNWLGLMIFADHGGVSKEMQYEEG
jgi:hypothetical protein